MKKLLLLLIAVSFFSCKNGEKEEKNDDTILVPSSEQTSANTPQSASVERGKEIYSDLCVTCHLPSGKGIPGTYPPLDDSNWLSEKRKESIRAVKYGLHGEITVNGEEYDNLMPSMGLTDKEVADVMNYTMNAWSNKIDPPVTEDEVAQIKEAQ